MYALMISFIQLGGNEYICFEWWYVKEVRNLLHRNAKNDNDAYLWEDDIIKSFKMCVLGPFGSDL